jgi:vesicular inhibitory amino acid transporter
LGLDVISHAPADSNSQLLNTLGDLIGTGLLATPIAIAHSGWVLGPIFLVLVGAVTLWT